MNSYNSGMHFKQLHYKSYYDIITLQKKIVSMHLVTTVA